MVFHCLAEHYGIKDLERFEKVVTGEHRALHDTALDTAQAGGWQRLVEPIDGAVVLIGRKQIYHHIGLYTNGGVLHSANGVGVVFQSIKSLKRANFRLFDYYAHKDIYLHSKEPP